MTRAKIVATIGPAGDEPGVLRTLIESGVAVARLNMAHEQQRSIEGHVLAVREAAHQAGRPAAVMADLAGIKIRTGALAGDPPQFNYGDQVVLVAGQNNRPGVIAVSYDELAADVKVGDQILISDGSITLTATDIRGERVIARVDIGGQLDSHQGVNLPKTTLRSPTITGKDWQDLEACLELGVDLIAMSFVRQADDIFELRGKIESLGHRVPVIAKIENHEAIPNLTQIIEAADGVMIARGDLGVEVATEDVPILQKQIIAQARQRGKAVIIATQMLDSMIRLPTPTRAEASDVANAVFDGADAVMLSGETAIGKFPVAAVQTMSRIINRAEEIFDYESALEARKQGAQATIGDAISYSTVQLASILRAGAICTSTESGHTARQVARYRPRTPIVAVSSDERTVRQLMLWWGIRPVRTEPTDNIDDMLRDALAATKATGLVSSGQRVVLTAGALVNVPGTTNLIKVEQLD